MLMIKFHLNSMKYVYVNLTIVLGLIVKLLNLKSLKRIKLKLIVIYTLK